MIPGMTRAQQLLEVAQRTFNTGRDSNIICGQ